MPIFADINKENTMKNKKLLVVALSTLLLFTSCGTLFTPTRQKIAFTGLPATKIYDNGRKVGEISEDGITTIKIKKKLADKQLLAKKEGYKNSIITLDAVLNPVSIVNLTNVFAWAIDLATGKCCRWDQEIIEVEMEKISE